MPVALRSGAVDSADAVTVKTERESDAANTTVNQESFKRWSKILEFIDNMTNFRIFRSLDLVHAADRIVSEAISCFWAATWASPFRTPVTLHFETRKF